MLAALSFCSVMPTAAIARNHPAVPTPTATPDAGAPTPSPTQLIPGLEAQLKASPSDVTTAVRLVQAYLQVGRPAAAHDLAQHLLASGVTKNAKLDFFNGAALRQLGRYPEAITAFQAASLLDPTDAMLLVELSNAYLQVNRIDEADRIARRALTFNTQDPRVFINYGVVLAVQKRFDDARQQFLAAAKLDPSNALPQLLAARTYVDQQQLSSALPLYAAVLRTNPNNISALQAEVQLAVAQHRIADAIAYDERLYSLAPDDQNKATVLNDEARIYLSVNDTQHAGQVVDREVKAFPQLALAHISAGDFAISQGREKDAVTEWTTALGPQQNNTFALMRLGVFALRKNDPQHAGLFFQRLVSLDARNDEAWFHLGQSEQLLNHFDRAREAFRHAFSIRQTVQAFADIASCDYELHIYSEASQIFDQLLIQTPKFVYGNPNLLYIVARTYDRANQPAKARSAYYRLLNSVKRGSNDEKLIRGYIANLGKGVAR